MEWFIGVKYAGPSP